MGSYDEDEVIQQQNPVNFNIPAKLNLVNVDQIMINPAVVAGNAADYSNLKAEIYLQNATAATADTKVKGDIAIAANGDISLDFQGYAGTYYVKIINPNNANFVLFRYFENLQASIIAVQNITEETTAVGFAVQAMKAKGTTITPSAVDNATKTTIENQIKTDLNTANKGTKDVLDALIADNNFAVVQVTAVTLNKTSTTIVQGQFEDLTATVLPENASNKNVTWTSSNAAVATVSQTGRVTGVTEGTANITVTTESGGKTAVCAVTIQSSNVPVTGVTVTPTTAQIAIGATRQLTATVAPATASNKNVTWASSAPTVATVSATGLVTGVAIGNAVITVTTAEGAFTATCNVQVTGAQVAATGVTLAPTTATIAIAGTQQLTATVAPENATDKTVAWTTSAQAVATVSNTGLVTGVTAGVATITVTTNSGDHTATCLVTVTPAPVNAVNFAAEITGATSAMTIVLRNVGNDYAGTTSLEATDGSMIEFTVNAQFSAALENGVILSASVVKALKAFQTVTFTSPLSVGTQVQLAGVTDNPSVTVE